ncbi:MAG: hypothetical protein AAB893_03580, partial [Patescibacteria group bacterium]
MCPDESTSNIELTKEQHSPFQKDHQPSLDWTQERRQKVIDKAWRECNARILDRDSNISSADTASVGLLWYQIVAAFQNGGEIGNLKFEQNILPTHSEYHIAKVLTLVNHLIEGKEKKGEKISAEDTLALVLAVLIHDLGVLRQKGKTEDEKLDQTQLYERHELRALKLAEHMINGLSLQSSGINKQSLISKVKLFIASTVVDLNMDFGVDPKDKKTKRSINPYNRQILKLLSHGKNAQLYGLDSPQSYVDEIKNQFTIDDQRTFLTNRKTLMSLVDTMSAADHGAYLLEPCRFGEINGLWRELNRLRFDEEIISHRKLPFGTTIAHEYFTSGFPTLQNLLYGDILREFIPRNPFTESEETAVSIEKALKQKEALQQNKPHEDPVSRFEGFFSPVQLLELIKQLEINVVKAQKLDGTSEAGVIKEIQEGKLIKRLNKRNPRIIEELKKFSDAYSAESYEAGKFNMLATNVLRELYKDLPLQQEQLFYESFEMMTSQAEKELHPDGMVTIHIAPFVYLDLKSSESARAFAHQINHAYERLSLEKRKKIKGITFTWRELNIQNNPLDTDGDFDLLVQICGEFNLLHTLRHGHDETYHPLLWSVSIAGKPSEDTQHLQKMLQEAQSKNISVLVHYGLETEKTTLQKRIEAVLEMDIAPNDPRISIHIDNHFDWFVEYYLSLNKSDPKRARLKNLIKSADPLGYLLTGGAEAHYWVTEFFRLFQNTLPATNNASNNGGLGISVHQQAIEQIVQRIRAG